MFMASYSQTRTSVLRGKQTMRFYRWVNKVNLPLLYMHHSKPFKDSYEFGHYCTWSWWDLHSLYKEKTVRWKAKSQGSNWAIITKIISRHQLYSKRAVSLWLLSALDAEGNVGFKPTKIIFQIQDEKHRDQDYVSGFWMNMSSRAATFGWFKILNFKSVILLLVYGYVHTYMIYDIYRYVFPQL